MKKSSLLLKIAAGAAALVVAVSAAGCQGAASASKGLDAALEYAGAKVSDYSSAKIRLSGIFSDETYCRANAAAMLVKADSTAEDFENIARYLLLDSITVADENGVITASYPEGDAGKKLKETEDRKTFNRICKGQTVKTMTDPVKGDEGYAILAGVPRVDGAGAVIIGFTSDEYADVTGENLAEKCGVNTIVLSEGAVLSSTLDKAEAGAALDSLGVKAEDLEKGSFSMTVDGKSYDCKSKTADELTVICAEPK